MTAAMQEHLMALLQASREERSEAAEALLVSLDEDTDEEVDKETWERSWAAELERRLDDDQAWIPGEQVFAELRAKFQGSRKRG